MNRRTFVAATALASLSGCLGRFSGAGPAPESGLVETASDPRTARRTWGDDYRSPSAFRVRIDRPTVQPTYQYRDRSHALQERAPESGGQWAFVYIWARNESDSTAYSPALSEFSLYAGNSRAARAYPVPEPAKVGLSYRDDGGCTCKRGEVVPNSVQDGWIAFVVPPDASVSDVSVVWTDSIPSGSAFEVEWSG